MNQQDLGVILIGIAIVFVGLLCIVLLCKVMSILCAVFSKQKKNVSLTDGPTEPSDIPKRGEFIAAVSAVIAEEVGKDASNIRILSVRKL